MFGDSIRDLLRFNARTFNEEYNSSNNPADIISFNITFIETDIAKGMIFKGERTGKKKNFTKSVSPGYEYISSFKLKNENIELVSNNGQSISFRLSIKEL